MVREVRSRKNLSLDREELPASAFVEGGVTYAVSGPCRSDDLKLWPLFFHWAWQHGELFSGEYQISIPELLEAFHHLGHDLEMRELWDSMTRLSQTRLEWVAVENHKKKAVGFSVLLASAMLEEGQIASVLTYTIPECLVQMIPDPEALAHFQGRLLEGVEEGDEMVPREGSPGGSSRF